MKNKWMYCLYGSFCSMLFFSACKKEETRTEKTFSAIDSTLVSLTDAGAQMMRINAEINPEKSREVTEAIKQYENLKPEERALSIYQGRKISDVLAPWGDPTDNIPATPELRRKTGWDIFEYISKTSDNNFDLAIKKGDALIKQIEIVNNFFKDLDQEGVSAIQFYQKLSNEEKQRLFGAQANNTKGKQAPIPNPDFEGRVGYNVLQGYNQLKLKLLTHYWKYTKDYNRYVGFKDKISQRQTGLNDDREFDLPISLNNEQ